MSTLMLPKQGTQAALESLQSRWLPALLFSAASSASLAMDASPSQGL
jgi:hypothetical protein